jgi:hypothetical protein
MAAGLASGTYLLASQAFVTPMQPSMSNNDSPSPSTMVTSSVEQVGTLGSTSSVAAAVGLAGMVAAAASANRRVTGSRMQRRAEPVSMAAAAVAAKAGAAAKTAAAAKGAAKVGGAVAGSATSGTLAQAAEEDVGEWDPELGGKTKWSVFERGTPEFKKAMEQKRRMNTANWDKYTSRNPEGFLNSGPGDPTATVDEYNFFNTAGGAITEDQMRRGMDVGLFNPAIQVGVTEPLGYFDPLGFCPTGDEKTFRKLRAAELKHGRVAMMGAVGAVFQHYVQFPGFEKVPTGLSAVNEAPGSYGAIALFLVAGMLEMFVWTESDDKAPGNFGDPAGWTQVGDGYSVDMRNRELNNGRAAMFAVTGIIAAELFTGKDAVEQLAVLIGK